VRIGIKCRKEKMVLDSQLYTIPGVFIPTVATIYIPRFLFFVNLHLFFAVPLSRVPGSEAQVRA
jgi:hypothetical protein